VITVTEEPGQILVKQSRYLSTGDVKAEDDATTWWVPLGLVGKSATASTSSADFLADKQDVIKNVDESFYKLNRDTTGFYRTNYPPARLAKLGTQIDRLSNSDKIGLIGDAAALAVSGEASTAGLLSFVKGFTSETDYIVWSTIQSSLSNVKSVFDEDDVITYGLQKFIIKLIGPAVEKIGWESAPSDDVLTTQLRALLILTAGLNGHEQYVTPSITHCFILIFN
jgi:aminopeptidase N